MAHDTDAGMRDIREGLVDNKNAVTLSEVAGDVQYLCLRNDTTIGIIRINNNRKVSRSELIDVEDLDRAMSGQHSGSQMFCIGRA